MTASSRWLRLSGAGLAILSLLFLLILLLHAGPVQAGSQGPDEEQASAGIAAPAEPGTAVVTITVEATSTTVVPGQRVTYTIELAHEGGTSPLQGQLFNPFAAWPGPLGDFTSNIRPHVDGMLVAATGTVSPTAVQASYGLTGSGFSGLRWRGSMAPDSTLLIRYPAEIKPCYDPDLATIRSIVAMRDQDGGTVTASADIQVDCYPAVDPANVSVVLGFGYGHRLPAAWDRSLVPGDGPLFPAAWERSLVQGTEAYYQIELTNSDPNPTILGLVGLFPSRSFNIGMPPSLQRTATLGWKVEGENPGNLVAAGTQNALFLAPLDPGETKVVTVPVQLAEDVPPESEFELQLGYCITYDGRFCPGADPQSTVPPASLEWLQPLSLTVRYRDLGDSPDSTSHHATPMPAYAGVQANFPTVFDPGTGPEQGPSHLNPRPFHLGRRVSPEAEADVGPDLDPTNNILPLANVANRDRRDDGLALKLLSFSQCQAARVPVRIGIRSAAAAYFLSTGTKGYLNLWLDGNHDGDWADSFSCPGGQRAFEHIVIDHPIDVAALGAGLHTLAVPTGPVPWSGQGTWLRATLSEKPSNKTLNAGGIDYGDGRGYGTPFLLGETEDYFLRPPGTAGAGPDMGLDLFAGWRTRAPRAEAGLSAASPNLEIHLTASYFKADYRNEGSETATDVVLTYLLAPALQGLVQRIVALPELQPQSITKEPGRIEISLGDIDPGSGGSVVVAAWECLTCTMALTEVQTAGIVTGSVSVESSNDINLANNSADSSVELPELIEVGFTSPQGQYLRTSGVTCHNDIELRGQTTPNTPLTIFADGFESGDASWVLSSDGSGTFEQTINLANGGYQIFLIPGANQSALEELDASASQGPQGIVKRIDKAVPLIAIVNNHLPWNPSSLTFVDSEGRVIQPMPLGFENQAGWYGHLKAGETYQLSLEYCGSDPDPIIQARLRGQTLTLADPDGDGVYVADIELPQGPRDIDAQVAASAPLTLSITSGSVETVFGGTLQATTEGVIYDSQSGQPLSATVTLLQAIDADYEAGFDIWPGVAHGQANPQATANDGEYAFWPEAGTYHLDASRGGYQPYRSWNVQTTGEPVNPNLPMAPHIADEPDYIVEIGDDGFEPSVLHVLPGSIVRWVNTGITDHTSTSTSPALVGPTIAGSGGWDSGRLSSGDSYVHQFAGEGTFTYADRANPSNTAQVRVELHRVYLSLITR